MSTPTVIAVTSPAGHDVGPAAAFLGRNLGDGLAVRIVPDNRHTLAPHTSPNPYSAPEAHIGNNPAPAVVALECLPSAWQDPQTNLGIIYAASHGGAGSSAGEPGDELPGDLHVMDELGLNPAHRVTVEAPGLRYRAQVPPPVEVVSEPHGLAAIARDSVLRGAGQYRTVLLEAGDGMTLLDAFHAFGLPPWSTHIQALELWVAIDLEQLQKPSVGTFVDTLLPILTTTLAATHVANTAQVEVNRQGGGWGADGTRLGRMYLALRNFQLLVPEVAGIGADGLAQSPEQGGRVPDEVADRLGSIVVGIEQRAGARVGAISTGAGPGGHEQWIDVRPGI